MLFLRPNAFEGTTTPSNADISPIAQILTDPTALALTITVSTLYFIVYLLFMIGVVTLFLQRRWKMIIAIILPIILLMYFPGPVSNSRFRIPAEPLISIVVAYGLVEATLLRTRIMKRLNTIGKGT